MKQFAKWTYRALASILGAPFFVWFWLSKRLIGPRAALEGMAQFLALFPGITGNWLRQGAYRRIFARCSDTCTICYGVLFSDPRVEIGEHVYIGPNCDIGSAIIEDDVLLGSAVHLLSGKHQHFSSDPTLPIRLQGGEFQTIRIGHGSWIGNGAIVMADVGHDAIVGAGAVVTHAVEAYSIVAGNPATLIRMRLSSDIPERAPVVKKA